MAFLNLNGWAVPIVTCEMNHVGIAGARGYSPNGVYQFQRNGFARTWSCRSGLLTSEERDALLEMLGHRGDGWRWGLQGTAPAGVHTDSKFFYSDKRRPAQSAEEVATVVSAYAADGTRVYDWNYEPISPCEGSEGAVMVDPASTNILSANQAHPTVGGGSPHLANVNGGTSAADSVRYWTGSGAVLVTAGSVNDGVEASTASATIGQVYQLTAHVYATDDNQQIRLLYRNGASTTINTADYTLPTAGCWYRVKVSGTQAADTTARILVTTLQASKTFGIDGLQIEQQDERPTAWLDPGADVWGSGNGVRPAGVLDYDTFCATWKQGFTMSAWFNAWNIGAASVQFIATTNTNNPRAFLVLNTNDTIGWNVIASDGSNLAVVTAAISEGVHHAVGTYDPASGSASLWFDGALAGTDTSWSGGDRTRFDIENTSTDFSVGSRGTAGVDEAPGPIGSLQFVPYAVPGTVAIAMYDSGTDARATPGVMPIGAYGDFLQLGDERVDVYGQVDSAPHEPWWNGSTFEKRGGRVAFTLYEAEKR